MTVANFIYGLFNDIVNTSDYTSLNVRMIKEWRINKDVERSGRGIF
jgi:hypothetical protein